MTVRVELHGTRVRAAHRRAMRRALRAGALHILSQSNQVVPLEEGVLERSGAVTVSPDGDLAVVSYGTVYARRQHEEITWRHDPGREAKYLENTVRRESQRALEFIAARYRREIRRGGGR